MSEEYREGYRAYQDGALVTDNPYQYDTGEFNDWQDGWWQAAQDD